MWLIQVSNQTLEQTERENVAAGENKWKHSSQCCEVYCLIIRSLEMNDVADKF